jgi:hypothetical protein
MCEFCSFGPPNSSNNNNRQLDRNDPFSFGGFFSADAINEAVRISKQRQQQQSRRKNGNDGSSSSSNEEDEGEGGEDSDGT